MSDDDLLKGLKSAGEWDEIDELVHELEKLLRQRNEPKKSYTSFDDLNFDKSCDELLAELDKIHKQSIDDLFASLSPPKKKTRAERYDTYIDQLKERLERKTNKPN